MISLYIRKAFGSPYRRAPIQAIEIIGVTSLAALALLFWLSRDFSRIGEGLLLLTLLLSGKQIWKSDRDEWLWLLMSGWLCFMVAVNAWASMTYPELAGTHNRYSRYYIKIFFFLAAGWWLGDNLKSIFWLFLLSTLGIYTEAWFNGGWDIWKLLLAGYRVDFGFKNAQHTSILFGTILLGLACFWRRFFTNRLWVITAPLWILLTTTAIIVVIGTQSRQVWLALLICMISVIFFAITNLLRDGFRWSRWSSLALAITALIVIITSSFFQPGQVIKQRLSAENAIIQQILSGDINNLSVTSVGVRIQQWAFAWQQTMAAPLTGHGGATKHALIPQSDLPQQIKSDYGHVHNSYLELGLAYGLPGLLLLPLVLSTLTYRLFAAWRIGSVPLDFTLFGLLALLFFLVVNVFESYIMYRSGYFFMLVVGGAIYSKTRPWHLKMS